jgi:hypothetical protein
MAKQRANFGSQNGFMTGVNKSGYQTYRDPNTGVWNSVHKRVAEKMVGGPIGPGREVHHIDGNKNNNQPSNLRIVSKEEHRRIHGK